MLGERFLAFLYPVVPREQEVEIDVAASDMIPAGGGIVAHTPMGHVALEKVDGEVRAFSAVCTHLGCIVTWQPGPNHVWYCPCHKGKYGRQGEVVGGPPPRPLDRLPVTQREGRVFVKMRIRPPEIA